MLTRSMGMGRAIGVLYAILKDSRLVEDRSQNYADFSQN